MPWLWIVGPFVAALVFLASFSWPDRFEDREVERWRKSTGPIVKKAKGGKAPKRQSPRALASIPGALARMVDEAGGGKRVAYYELVPKLAYLAVFEADMTEGSDHQTVVCKLEASAPTFVVQPLPIIDGQRAENDGVPFKKHPEFMEEMLVQGDDTKKIQKWLSRPLREALLDIPEAWLRVAGPAFALTHYGRFDAETLASLVATADVLFAEFGAGGGPSLTGEEDERERADEEDEEEEDEDDLDEDEADEGDAGEELAEKPAAAKPS